MLLLLDVTCTSRAEEVAVGVRIVLISWGEFQGPHSVLRVNIEAGL